MGFSLYSAHHPLSHYPRQYVVQHALVVPQAPIVFEVESEDVGQSGDGNDNQVVYEQAQQQRIEQTTSSESTAQSGQPNSTQSSLDASSTVPPSTSSDSHPTESVSSADVTETPSTVVETSSSASIPASTTHSSSSPSSTTHHTSRPSASSSSDALTVAQTAGVPTELLSLLSAFPSLHTQISVSQPPKAFTTTVAISSFASSPSTSSSSNSSTQNSNSTYSRSSFTHSSPFYVGIVLAVVAFIACVTAFVSWWLGLRRARRKRKLRDVDVPWVTDSHVSDVTDEKESAFDGDSVEKGEGGGLGSGLVLSSESHHWEPRGDRDVGEPKRTKSFIEKACSPVKRRPLPILTVPSPPPFAAGAGVGFGNAMPHPPYPPSSASASANEFDTSYGQLSSFWSTPVNLSHMAGITPYHVYPRPPRPSYSHSFSYSSSKISLNGYSSDREGYTYFNLPASTSASASPSKTSANGYYSQSHPHVYPHVHLMESQAYPLPLPILDARVHMHPGPGHVFGRPLPPVPLPEPQWVQSGGVTEGRRGIPSSYTYSGSLGTALRMRAGSVPVLPALAKAQQHGQTGDVFGTPREKKIRPRYMSLDPQQPSQSRGRLEDTGTLDTDRLPTPRFTMPAASAVSISGSVPGSTGTEAEDNLTRLPERARTRTSATTRERRDSLRRGWDLKDLGPQPIEGGKDV
ncbi:hypothetical protein D9758_005470 [Tetrapyrgos nigripes]|uniref:Uncharacterized protein n=1 Tax=Tetrapyrgos nigripes TaxID=182062 RepID=A0A8H5GHS4_9AGAR|nr:hypothetical protein D9758_005470 [Tetrapyrgos nigripes]